MYKRKNTSKTLLKPELSGIPAGNNSIRSEKNRQDSEFENEMAYIRNFFNDQALLSPFSD
ncbi:MAG: hypothetical protein HQM10_19450 [Candidatus Riflebacteria bacterium]|nr:hypothetical protein [Candidatus Riflebacteria bacterium]